MRDRLVGNLPEAVVLCAVARRRRYVKKQKVYPRNRNRTGDQLISEVHTV
jgi:hypothetical protein